MAINTDEIEKYIFDPENPKQCKSYNLLLKLAQKNTPLYFSRDFLIEIFLAENIINKLKDELWDLPDNFNSLTKQEKVKLYISQFSKNDFIDFLKENIEYISSQNIENISNILFYLKEYESTKTTEEEVSDRFVLNRKIIRKKINTIILKSFISQIENSESIVDLFNYTDAKEEYSNTDFSATDQLNKILFYNFEGCNLFDFDLFDKATILITTFKNYTKKIKTRTKNINRISPNTHPLFLKKIEDVHILLNILQSDLKREKQTSSPKEKISNLNTITIQNFFSIKNITLSNLKDKKEIYIVGENGDGKTLLLQAITIGLKGTQEDGLKIFREIENQYKIEIPNAQECKNNLIAYGALRNSNCQIKEDHTGYLTLFSGEYDLKSPIKWLQYLDYSEKTNKQTILSTEKAIKLLKHLLNSDIAIDISPDSVTFTEKGSLVSFDQLSAGYKGVITIICDLIARLSENQTVENIADFQGTVLIDEIELHLHPKWQYGFMQKLRKTFPLIQFIVTTHSPTVILGASTEAVYYQITKEHGEVKISDAIETKNDFINDIQTEIFGFDVTQERIDHPDRERHNRAKSALLDLIDTVEDEEK